MEKEGWIIIFFSWENYEIVYIMYCLGHEYLAPLDPIYYHEKSCCFRNTLTRCPLFRSTKPVIGTQRSDFILVYTGYRNLEIRFDTSLYQLQELRDQILYQFIPVIGTYRDQILYQFIPVIGTQRSDFIPVYTGYRNIEIRFYTSLYRLQEHRDKI